MKEWSLTLRCLSGVLSTVDSGEPQFVIIGHRNALHSCRTFALFCAPFQKGAGSPLKKFAGLIA